MANILIIDDSEFVLEIAAEELEDAGHSVETASNVFAAMRELQRKPVDLVLLDVHMPGVEGTHLLEHFKNNVLLRLARVVLFSEQPPAKLEEIAQNHNIAGVVTKKDVYDGRLVWKVTQILDKRRSIEDLSTADAKVFQKIVLFETLVHQDHGAAREVISDVDNWEVSPTNKVRLTEYMLARLESSKPTL